METAVLPWRRHRDQEQDAWCLYEEDDGEGEEESSIADLHIHGVCGVSLEST